MPLSGDADVIIRAGRLEDTPSLRNLAVSTAYFGDSGSYFFSDLKLLADLIIGYYPRYEIEHLWVAELNNKIVGYVCGHFNESKYLRCICFKILPLSLIKAFFRTKLFSLKSLRLIYYNIRHLIASQEVPTKDIKEYSVHIHQNIKDGFRGTGIGSKLLDMFLEAVDKERAGIQFKALRREERFKFFERYGFKRYYYRRAYVWEKWLNKSPLYYMGYTREPKI